MTWIMNNWDKEWSDNAIATIKELVGFFFEFERYTNSYFLDGRVPGSRHARCCIGYGTIRGCDECLAEDGCRLWRDADIADGKATFGQKPTQQSVQEEYSIYVMGALSAGSTVDTLGFWKVKTSPISS